MKKVIDFFKSIPFKFICIMIAVNAVFVVYIMREYVDDPQDPATKLLTKKVKEVQDEFGEMRQQQETTHSETVAGISQEDYNRLKLALNIKDDQILSINNINAKLRDSVKVARVERDAANNKVWNWEKKTESGSVIKSTMNEKDSVLHSEVDIKLNNTDYVDKGGLFKQDRYYTDWYSPDQNIKVNGAQSWRKETVIKPKRFGIGFHTGYGITEDLKPSMYIGVGLSYNFINF